MLISSSSVFAQTWQVVDEAPGASSGAWSEVECKNSSGWAVCERQAPVVECKYRNGSPATYFLMREGANSRPVYAAIHWDNVVVASTGSSDRSKGLPNTIQRYPMMYTYGSYKYYVDPSQKRALARVGFRNKDSLWKICRVGI